MTPDEPELLREVDQRVRLELGGMVYRLIVLQAQVAFLTREVERLKAE